MELSDRLKISTMNNVSICKHKLHWLPCPGADPEGGFGDLSPLNLLEVKIILNV